MSVADLAPATRDLLAPVCRTCEWWQVRVPGGGGPSAAPPDDPANHPGYPPLRGTWEWQVTSEAGCFGKALLDGNAVVGTIQAAPARLVPRAGLLPAGPPSQDAVVLLCAYFYDEEYLGGFQRLLGELEAALKQRGFAALEAFALLGTHGDDRFRGYLRACNLFNHEVLEGSGFRPASRLGCVARYRLELETLVAVPRWSSALARLEKQTAVLPV